MEATRGMDAAPIPKPETPKLFTAQEASKRFVDSFYFSQGNAGLQRDIVRYLAIVSDKALPTDDQFLSDFQTVSADAIRNYLGTNPKGGHIHTASAPYGLDNASLGLRKLTPREIVGDAASNEYEMFTAYMSRDRARILKYERNFASLNGFQVPVMTREQLVEEIAIGSIMRDFRFLVLPTFVKGRPRKEMSLFNKIKGIGKKRPDKIFNPRKDKHLSQFLYYGLLGNSTETPEYDLMFADIAKWYRNGGREKLDRNFATADDRNGLKILESIAKIFNKSHSDMQVTI